ncbi:helix-hairpin-helix domain-containing protein [Oceanobacillus kimchii]|uniref:helix-hairpin-helix domain-containing protein n=1 Tax=Oceanobacillus kimchii TaxID=746691 RepID=UPI0021A31860|nr:helix-hairpin-helix domain-containing protein [Oceanobacillus kimchii]MCT1577061.1 helix-hairpin-helix domain-containing protein [Oceanobacillus kimchii]MCT2135131.1 helix-hairpin-helix domain-containing protein [Oceanobacillus kimchii]
MNNSIDKITFKNLLATTTREKEDSYVVNELFSRYPSIQELLDVTEEELLQIKGIGKIKAKQIVAALQLARMNPCPVEQRFTIRSPEDAYDYLRDMQYLNQAFCGTWSEYQKSNSLPRNSLCRIIKC